VLYDTFGSTTYTPDVSQQVNGADTCFHTDWLGSTRYLSDNTGNNFPDALRYDAFGNRSATGGTYDPTPFQFAGEWGYESEFATGPEQGAGLQYLGGRCYDPAAGRLISQDPVGFVGGIKMEDLASVYSAEDLYRRGVPRLGQALEALVQAWGAGAREEGILIRLLFLVWYRMVEPLPLTGLPAEYAGPSFEEVFESAGGEAGASPLVLWAVGQMAHLSPWAVGDESAWREAAGRLLDRARQLRPDISAVDFAGMGTAGDYFGHLLDHITAGNQERARE
jgi:RHS repeat-associated protein